MPAGKAIDAVIEEMNRLTQVEFDDMYDVERFLKHLPTMYATATTAMRRLGNKLVTEYPAASQMDDEFATCATAVDRVVTVTEDFAPLFRRLHEYDFTRYENGRPNEQFRDAQNNNG